MGEAAPCLMRSVSQPLFASCEYKEGDPLRALTTSISFGRFMTEPLDWEKWSSFSHNRTLEDVQKHSRPGAVAEKKAFFEAHYKKIASKKATKTKSPQKENKPPNPSNHSPQTNISSPRSDTLSVSAIDETQENESSKPIATTTTPAFSQHIDEQDIEIASCKDVCSPSANLVLEQFRNVEDDLASSPRQVEQENVSSENISLEKHKNKRNKGPEISLSKKEASRKTPILPKKAARNETEKKRSALQSLHMSMNFPPAGIKNRILKTLSKPKDRLIQQPLNLKVSINEVKKASQVLPPPENKSHSSVCTKKPRSSSSSSTVPSSFSFRSEERAAKRKEFFQKLEEKGNKKETEKIHLQPKLKTTNDDKKLRRSTALEAKTFASETKVISSSIQKVPQMQPCSPKLGRKPTPRLVLKDTCCQSSKPKNFIEINKKKLSSSMAFLTTKKKNDSSSKKQC